MQPLQKNPLNSRCLVNQPMSKNHKVEQESEIETYAVEFDPSNDEVYQDNLDEDIEALAISHTRVRGNENFRG